jgi:cytochrome c
MLVKKISITLVTMIALCGSAYASDPQALAQSKNCLACHAVENKIVGPSFKDIAAKYKNDKTAEARLIKKVIAGGVGVWGQIPMPANPVTEAESRILVQWVLNRK